eukprot:6482612-Prymnesium_polylepis.1
MVESAAPTALRANAIRTRGVDLCTRDGRARRVQEERGALSLLAPMQRQAQLQAPELTGCADRSGGVEVQEDGRLTPRQAPLVALTARGYEDGHVAVRACVPPLER